MKMKSQNHTGGNYMKESLNLIRLLAMAGAVLMFAGTASAQEQPFRFAGTTCPATPYLHCPDSECSGATVVNQGNVVEMKTRRTYFLDYPCDLKKGEKVTFILSLHGFGSYGNWQRNYFPIMDYKDKYRLVIFDVAGDDVQIGRWKAQEVGECPAVVEDADDAAVAAVARQPGEA